DDFPLLSVVPAYKTGWDMAVDLYEEKENLVAEMNLPGIDPKQIDITFQNGSLRIFGKRIEEKEKGYFRKEIHRGEFERVIQLPFEVKTEKTEAHYNGGVLKILMPKKEELKAK